MWWGLGVQAEERMRRQGRQFYQGINADFFYWEWQALTPCGDGLFYKTDGQGGQHLGAAQHPRDIAAHAGQGILLRRQAQTTEFRHGWVAGDRALTLLLMIGTLARAAPAALRGVEQERRNGGATNMTSVHVIDPILPRGDRSLLEMSSFGRTKQPHITGVCSMQYSPSGSRTQCFRLLVLQPKNKETAIVPV